MTFFFFLRTLNYFFVNEISKKILKNKNVLEYDIRIQCEYFIFILGIRISVEIVN